jgi:hypothetical protein
MPTVTDIRAILDRQDALNAELRRPLEAHRANHLDTDWDAITPSVAEPRSGGIVCEDCGCVTVGVFLETIGDIAPVCRDGIKALKLASLAHRDDRTVRLFGSPRYSPHGMPTDCQSITMPIAEAERQIALGLFEISNSGTLTIHDLKHNTEKHCRGCRRETHPGCDDNCADLVDKRTT